LRERGESSMAMMIRFQSLMEILLLNSGNVAHTVLNIF
jgi:hypothetical protein